MIFKYKGIDTTGVARDGSIEAISIDVAINSLQRRGLVLSSIVPDEKRKLFAGKITFFDHVSNKEIVVLSRQMSTLFNAQVSALHTFRLLSEEAESKTMRETLSQIADDLQGGSSISKALAKYPKVFSGFYVNMIRSGEETGKLDQILLYLADYLDRTYEVTTKAKNALIYPAFVIFVFITVMVLMLTMVIPNISKILTDSGQAIPVYTRVVLGMSSLLVNYGVYFLVALIIAGFFFGRYATTKQGMAALSRTKISLPYLGNLYRKLYLSRIADNLNTMLLSAIPILKALEITSSIVGNKIYEGVLDESLAAVKGGTSLSDAFSRHPEVPGIMIQMIKVGEETGELGQILQNLSKFYSREVINAVDTLVDLIEPVMIVMLGLGVAFLLASVLVPIYNLSAGA